MAVFSALYVKSLPFYIHHPEVPPSGGASPYSLLRGANSSDNECRLKNWSSQFCLQLNPEPEKNKAITGFKTHDLGVTNAMLYQLSCALMGQLSNRRFKFGAMFGIALQNAIVSAFYLHHILTLLFSFSSRRRWKVPSTAMSVIPSIMSIIVFYFALPFVEWSINFYYFSRCFRLLFFKFLSCSNISPVCLIKKTHTHSQGR